MGSDCFANKRCKSQHSLFVDDETIVDSAASQSIPCDDSVGSRQPDAAIIPLASCQQGYEPPNTGNSIDHDVTEVLGRLACRKSIGIYYLICAVVEGRPFAAGRLQQNDPWENGKW